MKGLRRRAKLCCDWLSPGAVELPSYLVGCFAMDRIGRKKTCAPSLLLAGVACMLIIVVPAVSLLPVFIHLWPTGKGWRELSLSLEDVTQPSTRKEQMKRSVSTLMWVY